MGLDPLDKTKTAAFQAGYIAFQNLTDDPNFKSSAGRFRVTPVGLDDDTGGTSKVKKISEIDGIYGNTTVGQVTGHVDTEKEWELADVPDEDIEQPDPEDPIEPLGPIASGVEPAPFWLQDIINTAGAASDLYSIRKHQPWQAFPNVDFAEPTFYDPTRQLAANAEQANIAAQQIGAYASPQQMNARLSAVQGQAAKQAADTLGQYNNQNVSVANQFEQFNTQVYNQGEAQRAGLATQLYDKYSLLNQNFDNAKRAARANVREQYTNALTNRAMTQTLNSLYPQYHVDPVTGGFTYYTGQEKSVVPNVEKENDLMRVMASLKNKYQGMGWSDDVYLKAAKAQLGMPDDNPMGMDPSFFANYMNMTGRR